MKIDTGVLFEKPTFDTMALLTIDALAPLSLVSKAPGKHYHSQSIPSDIMIMGMLENALGWHIGEPERPKLIERVNKARGAVNVASGSGFSSLLQHHIRIELQMEPAVTYFRDLWSQHLKGSPFVGGSREYDFRAIPIMNAVDGKKVTLNDLAKSEKNSSALTAFQAGDSINLSVVRPYFPQYYVSPTPREYVEPTSAYKFRLSTSRRLAEALLVGLSDPEAPLYLGTNDGWVDVTWEEIVC